MSANQGCLSVPVHQPCGFGNKGNKGGRVLSGAPRCPSSSRASLRGLHQQLEQEQASEDAGEAGLIEPKGRQAASFCADDMIRAFPQQHRCVLGGLFPWLELQASLNHKTLSGVDRWKMEIL